MTKIGIACEDVSDYDALTILIRRISGKHNIPFEKFLGNGCGKLLNKLDSYAKGLADKKCTALIVVHDKDKEDLSTLEYKIKSKLEDCTIVHQLICIPVEELEAWFLSDMKVVKNVFSLKKEPKAIANPESVVSPKEALARIVRKNSEKRKISISTIHNKRLAEGVNINQVSRKCSSFQIFSSFVSGLN